MQKEVEKLEFVHRVNFDYIDLLKNNGRFLIFDDSCEQTCNSKAFFDNATAGGQSGLSTVYNKEYSFQQSKLGRDVELQNTHINLFMSLRDVMQVTTVRAQLGFGSKLVDSYRDATSVPWGNLLIDLSLRTISQLQTPDPVPQSIIFRTGWNSQKVWTMNTQSLSTLQVFQSFSHKRKSLFLSVLPKRLYRVSSVNV